MLASIIIPTFGRSESLAKCLASLDAQTERRFEVILVREEGELAKLRNDGAKRATGDYLIFIDDDVICSPGWLDGITKSFSKDKTIGGVSGPSTITDDFRGNRDIFRFKLAKRLYDYGFCFGRHRLPGHVTRAGAWTTGAADSSCSYEGEVMFLEACNMAFRSDIFRRVRGFDESFRGVGDWSEPDLSYRIRRAGFRLWFSTAAKLEHRPSKSGAFKKRKSDSVNRLSNYLLFSERWVKPHWSHNLYKLFLRSYYALAPAQ